VAIFAQKRRFSYHWSNREIVQWERCQNEGLQLFLFLSGCGKQTWRHRSLNPNAFLCATYWEKSNAFKREVETVIWQVKDKKSINHVNYATLSHDVSNAQYWTHTYTRPLTPPLSLIICAPSLPATTQTQYTIHKWGGSGMPNTACTCEWSTPVYPPTLLRALLSWFQQWTSTLECEWCVKRNTYV
jgi:hypothetical protein